MDYKYKIIFKDEAIIEIVRKVTITLRDMNESKFLEGVFNDRSVYINLDDISMIENCDD